MFLDRATGGGGEAIYEDGGNSEPIGRNEEFVLGHITYERLVNGYVGM